MNEEEGSRRDEWQRTKKPRGRMAQEPTSDEAMLGRKRGAHSSRMQTRWRDREEILGLGAPG